MEATATIYELNQDTQQPRSLLYSVDREALRALYSRLEQWAAGAAPGNAGTGTMWEDGDLGYSIAVSGNTFKQTGGDTGSLTGIFTGQNHEGATGTLERSDLTAAFGASR